jgi:hypothetical protein
LAPDQYKVSGVLTIKDVSLPIELRIEMTQTLQDTWKFSSKFAKFSGAINRQAFGLNWNKTFDQQALILGDEISFQGVFQLQPSRKVSVGNKHLIPDSKTMRRLESTTGKYIVDGVKIDQAVSNSAVQKNVEVAEQTDQIIGHRQQTLRQWLWWPAFIFLGLLGFLGTIILAYFIKNKMMQLGANYFRKTFWPEILSDILIILFVFIYSLSYWYVGWGE